MKRPIYWKHARNATPVTGRAILVPVYGIGPWWAHLVHWAAGWAVAHGISLTDWSERFMRREDT